MHLKLFNFFTTTLLISVICVETKNYIVAIQNGSLTYYSKEYAENVTFTCTKPNKNDVIVNVLFTVIKSGIGRSASISAEAFRLVNNKYKQLPLPLEVNLCEMFEKNKYLKGLRELTNHGNMTPCAVTKGHYYIKDYKPELDLPPVIPAGQYFVKGFIKFGKIPLFNMEWYAVFYRV